MRKRRLCLVLALWAVLCPLFRVRGDTPEGSVQISMRLDGCVISGGELTLYQVAGGAGDSFVLTEDFASSGVSLENFHSPETARELADFAVNKNLPGISLPVDSTGVARFDGLARGLYLIVQSECAEGFYPINPFLVSIPQISDGAYQYHIEAAPKLRPEEPTEPTEKPGLPQTGQLNWPVPILAGIGLICAGTGLWLCFGRKREEDET